MVDWSGKIQAFQVGKNIFLDRHFLLQVVLDNPSNIFFTGQRVEGRVIIIVTIINHHHY